MLFSPCNVYYVDSWLESHRYPQVYHEPFWINPAVAREEQRWLQLCDFGWTRAHLTLTFDLWPFTLLLPRLRRMTITCFNCGEDHHMKDCPQVHCVWDTWAIVPRLPRLSPKYRIKNQLVQVFSAGIWVFVKVHVSVPGCSLYYSLVDGSASTWGNRACREAVLGECGASVRNGLEDCSSLPSRHWWEQCCACRSVCNHMVYM